MRMIASEPLIALDALAEVPVLQLVPQDQRQGTGADQDPSVTNGQAVAIESSNASIPVAVDFGATSVEVASISEAQAPTLATGPVQTVLPEEQAGLQLQGSDAQATLRAVAALGLDETLMVLFPDSHQWADPAVVSGGATANSEWVGCCPSCVPSEFHRGSIRVFRPHLGDC